jgi:hypothetical protein
MITGWARSPTPDVGFRADSLIMVVGPRSVAPRAEGAGSWPAREAGLKGPQRLTGQGSHRGMVSRRELAEVTSRRVV